jgi:hypothetical protein
VVWLQDKQINQWNRMANSKIDHMQYQFIFEKNVRILKWNKNNFQPKVVGQLAVSMEKNHLNSYLMQKLLEKIWTQTY